MGLFSRIGAVIRGIFGLSVRRFEERNPEALFEDIKNQIEKARKQAEKQIFDLQTNAELIKIEMNNAEKNLRAIRARVEAAQRQQQKDLLIDLLMQEEEYQNAYESLRQTYENAMEEVAKVREDYRIFESEMNARLNELKTLKSQTKIAKLRENINSVSARYSSKTGNINKINESLERARDIVNRNMARANAVESLNDSNIEMKLKRLDMDSARERARIRAEALLSGDRGFEVRERKQDKLEN